MKLVGIVGTASTPSATRTLLEYLHHHHPELGLDLIEVDQLPLFNQDHAVSQAAPLQKINQQLTAADGVIIAVSEHNHTLTAALKSFLEWCSFDLHPFTNKPVMIVGTSTTRLGSANAQTHLRAILDAPGVKALVLPGDEFLLSDSASAFTEAGELRDAKTADFLESSLQRFLRFIPAVAEFTRPAELTMAPGTYEVTTSGHNGKLPMKVALSAHRIEDIQIDTSTETAGIADAVFTKLPQEILAGQTLNVDTIAGASITSKGVVDGVVAAVKQAGGDPQILRERPKQAARAEKIAVEYHTDVVVVGGGGAGLAAASRTLQQGRNVIVVEKAAALGGNTVRAGGPMNAADPSWQKQFAAHPGEAATLKKMLSRDPATIDPEYQADFRALQEEIKAYLAGKHDYLFDSPRWHEIQTYLGGKRVDLNGQEIHGDYQLVKTLATHALDSVHWLEEIGVHFDHDEVTMPVGANWRRGHKPTEALGFAYIKVLGQYVKDHGGQIMLETKVTDLLQDDQGRVIGLKATAADRELTIYARRVILASGGFGANTKMIQQYNTYWPSVADDIATTNAPTITGDGIKLGQQAGAALVGMGFTQMMPVAEPKTGELFSAIQVEPANYLMVNTKGKRFVDEFESRDVLTKAALENGGLFYLIADEKIKNQAYNTGQEQLDQQVAQGRLFRADTLADLAKQIGIDPAVLEATVNTYNGYVAAGKDPDFGKEAFDLQIDQAPFYATPRMPATHHTMGGLKIDPQAHVLDEDGRVIKGLYAAGEVAGGLHAGNRLGGNSLADIFTFGRIASETAVAELFD